MLSYDAICDLLPIPRSIARLLLADARRGLVSHVCGGILAYDPETRRYSLLAM